jgi:putative component of toxin-antitoxin plasmid stabilization module
MAPDTGSTSPVADRPLVILLCGGDKRTQSRDIKKANEIAEKLED